MLQQMSGGKGPRRALRRARGLGFQAALCLAVASLMGFGGAVKAWAVDKDKAMFSKETAIGKKGKSAAPEHGEGNIVPMERESDAPKPMKPEDVKGPHSVITIEETTKDFGTVWVGPTLSHEFTVKNTGDAVLEITKVKPSCGCTIAGQYPKTLNPGETGKLPFAINSSKLQSRFEKSITVTSNDPITPEVRLKLRGEVKQYIDIVPNSANFGRLMGDEAQERVLNIANNTEKPLELKLTKPEDGGFKFELITKEPGQKFELRVKANPPYAAGTMKGSAFLETNVELQKQVEIVARAAVPERLDIQPQSITVSNTPGAEQGLSRVIRFTNYGEPPVKVLEAVADDPAIKLTLNERTEGKAYTVLVELPQSYDPGPGGKKISLKTDDKEKKVIEIPVLAPARPTEAAKPAKPAESLVGQAAPMFELASSGGKALSNETLKEAITVLDFFAVNCGFCKKQLPRLETIRQEYEGKGVRFVAVGETMRQKFSEEEMKAKLDEIGFKGELAYDPDNKVGPLFQANSFPTMVVLGKSGKIEAVNLGNIADLESRLKGQLDALIAGKPVPTPPPERVAQQQPPRATPESLVGKPAPTFTLDTVEGKKLGTAELASAPATILNFFAPNCGFCKKQIPRMEEVRKKYADKGVRFVNVSQNMRQPFTQEQVMETLKGLGYQGEVAINHENTVGGMFNASGFPTMVVLGKNGKVEAVNVGNVADLDTRLPGQLDAIIEGKPIPQQFATAQPPATPPTQPQKRPAEELVGQLSPEFTITTLDGKSVSNADFAKSPATVLNFVAPNCGFCKKQLPTVEKVRQEYEAKGVRFVNVSQTMRQEFTTEQMVETFKGVGSQLELAKDEGNKVGQMFKAMSYPTMVVIGSDNKIAHVNVGAIPDIDSRLKTQLDGLINSKKATP